MSHFMSSEGWTIIQPPVNNPPACPIVEINHITKLQEDLTKLSMNIELSDVTFIVDNCEIKSHRIILASRSEYFRALLFGGFDESHQTESITIEDTTSVAFNALLKYIYTGRLALKDFSQDGILDILSLSHKYGFEELETSISEYLKNKLIVDNVINVYDISLLYNLQHLYETCQEFLDQHASEILSHPTFLTLSESALSALVSRDSFYAPEIEIFNGVLKWVRENSVFKSSVINKIRLPLLSLSDLLDTVRQSELYDAEKILDAIDIQNDQSKSKMMPYYRGRIAIDENIASSSSGAVVTKGEMTSALIDGNETIYDQDAGYARHIIEDPEGLVVRLGQLYIINTIRLLLWDKDNRSYGYFVEVSVDDVVWERIADYSSYMCRSWQTLHFSSRVVKYIRIVGTYNSVNRVFHLVSLQASYRRNPLEVMDGIIQPLDNIASVSQYASVLEGVSRNRNALINGDISNYDWDSGYTCHQLGSGAIVIQLAQPYYLSSMRLLLWDCDDRCYSYYVEVSNDQKEWSLVCDRTREDCRGWQTLVFPPVIATFVKLVGTRNTANEVFHIVHFETPAVTFSDDNERKSTRQSVAEMLKQSTGKLCKDCELNDSNS